MGVFQETNMKENDTIVFQPTVKHGGENILVWSCFAK